MSIRMPTDHGFEDLEEGDNLPNNSTPINLPKEYTYITPIKLSEDVIYAPKNNHASNARISAILSISERRKRVAPTCQPDLQHGSHNWMFRFMGGLSCKSRW